MPSEKSENQRADEYLPPDLTKRLEAICAEVVEKAGVKGAERVWLNTLKAHGRSRGRPTKTELLGWEVLALELYDRLANDPHPESLPRHIALLIHSRYKKMSTKESVIAQVRELISERRRGKFVRVDKDSGLPFYTVLNKK
jgi:hypothetical protein